MKAPPVPWVARVAARLVEPASAAGPRRHTRLLGALWISAAVWLLLGVATGLFEDAWRPGLLGLAALAVVLGATLLRMGHRRLRDRTYVVLVIAGTTAISLAVFWGGTHSPVLSVLYVYVTCFCFIAFRSSAIPLVTIAATMHLGVLLVGGSPAPLGIWVLTWGPALVTGALAGSLVRWQDDAMEQLRVHDEHRTRFIATVSHELRTPLTAILGFTELLRERWDLLDDEQRQEYIAVIERQAGRQLRLVEDVLALTTGRSNDPVDTVPHDVELGALLQRVCEAVRVPVMVEVTGRVVVRADPDHVEQILTNLLVNAERYGAPPYELRAFPSGRVGRVEVIDHGPGLVGGLDGGLAEPFVQGDTGDRRVSAGVGLGLTICRRLVVANAGDLVYEDVPGGGACLRLDLPLARPSRA